MIATIVQTKELLETVVASVVAGIGVTFAFAVTIWGVGRFVDHSREEQHLAAGVSGLIALLALLFVAAAVVFGIVVMTSK
jgi:hypothetical protein